MTNDATTTATRRPEEFEAQAKARGMALWPHHICGLCGYIVRFVFDENATAFFDEGCYCTNSPDNRRLSSWLEVADFYNRQTNAKWLADQDRYWGFDAPDYAPPPLDAPRKPKVYIFCVAYNGRDVRGLALTEDGRLLAEHISSSPGWSKRDMPGHTEAYAAAFPEGYELVWLDPPDYDDAFWDAFATFRATDPPWGAPSLLRRES